VRVFRSVKRVFAPVQKEKGAVKAAVWTTRLPVSTAENAIMPVSPATFVKQVAVPWIA